MPPQPAPWFSPPQLQSHLNPRACSQRRSHFVAGFVQACRKPQLIWRPQVQTPSPWRRGLSPIWAAPQRTPG